MNLQPRTSSRLWIRLLFLALGYIAFILLGSPEGLRGVAWTPIQAEFKVTPDFLGVLLFPPTVGYLLSSFFSGRVTGLLGTGRALACAAALMGMGLVGYGVAPTWLAIVSIGFAIGFGGSSMPD
ncbi:MAG: hypothetical protein HS103_06080 [Anaerolineales bacterium]|nr:hypothetical protein [Anaerolineales bacterium]